MKTYTITADELDKLANYVASKPWVESNPFMALLMEVSKREQKPESVTAKLIDVAAAPEYREG